MAIQYLLTDKQFDLKMFKENENNRWKFLEEMSPKEAEGAAYFLKSPIPVISFTISYILFVKLIGPFLMSFREPFKLKTLIRFYNLLMVFLAGLLFFMLYNAVDSLEAMFDCKKIFSLEDLSATKTYQMANFILIVRLSEYLDTVFFTLRKKQNQVSFLHVFHHAFVPMYAYWILRTAPCRYNVFIILINSFIHIVMYFYYFLATFQEPTQSNDQKQKKHSFIMLIVHKLLLFKKYITQLQILQFVSLAIYALSVCFRKDRCGVPTTYIVSNLLLAFGFLGLFLHFYMSVYRKQTGSRSVANNKSRTD